MEFQLFKIKVHPSKQTKMPFMGSDKTESQILKDAIFSAKRLEIRKKQRIWHIGDVSEINDTGLYLRIGRVSPKMIETYDEKESKFMDQEFDVAPYTHVVLDLKDEILAIAQKPQVSPYTISIANKLRDLLNKEGETEKVEFEIKPLFDPIEFITYLKEAYTITKFWVYFSRPNPKIDGKKDVMEPLKKVLSGTDGKKGKIELYGDNLDSTSLESITRSATSGGDNKGGANITTPESPKKSVTKNFSKENPIIISAEDLPDDKSKVSLLKKMIARFRDITKEDRKT
jgi:hypothetical protein